MADFEHFNAGDAVAFLLGIATARHQDPAEAKLARFALAQLYDRANVASNNKGASTDAPRR